MKELLDSVTAIIERLFERIDKLEARIEELEKGKR